MNPSREELEYARAMGVLGLKSDDPLEDDLSDHVYRMKKRIEALETALLDACREKAFHGHTTTLISSARKLKVPGVENYDDWYDERTSRLEKAEARIKELEGVLDGYGARDMEEMSQKLKSAEIRIQNQTVAIAEAELWAERARVVADLRTHKWHPGGAKGAIQPETAELRELREIAKRNVADAQHLRQSAIALETERDALRAQVAAARAVLEIRSEGWAQDALRAQVAAARAVLEIRSEGWAQDALRAMDEAKNE